MCSQKLQGFQIHLDGYFPTQFLSKWWNNVMELLWGSFSDSLICWLSQGVLKISFLDIWLTLSFAVSNFENTYPMWVIFFSKCSKFDVDFRYPAKNWQNIFCFLDYCSWIGCGKFFLLQRESLSSAVDVITKTPRISDTSIFQLNFSQRHEGIWLNCHGAVFQTVLRVIFFFKMIKISDMHQKFEKKCFVC